MILLIELRNDAIVNIYTFENQEQAERFIKQSNRYKSAKPDLEWAGQLFTIWSIENSNTALLLMDAKICCINTPVPGGHFETDINTDPTYPGIDSQFIPDESASNDIKSFPRVRFEKIINEELRVMVWNDLQNEDYTQKIKFDNI